MKPSDNKTGKLSHIRVGAIIHTVGGGIYRCTSKLASGGEVLIRLADLQGKPVQTPADFRPISPALARFAAWMRLAYNKDFDLYVKEYITEAGLPIDPKMDWSKFFQAKIAPKLISRDEEIQDEAIHQIIITSLVERKALANFTKTIERFPEHIRTLPLEKQVTKFLMQTFNWRVEEANRYIKDIIFQDETSSMWTDGDEDEDVNLLDTEEAHTHDSGFDTADSDIEVAHFRVGFEKYLESNYGKETVANFLSLFDLLYAHLREGDLPFGVDIYDEWKEEETVPVEGQTLVEGQEPATKVVPKKGKTLAYFKALFAKLPKVIDAYVSNYLNDSVNSFIDIMRQLGKKQEPQTVMSGLFGGLKLADEFPINHEIEQTPPDSGSDSNSGSSGGNLPSLEDAGGEAGEVGGMGELAELAPLALAAAKKATQWEVPKCKACGKPQDLHDCPACKERFCGDCLLNHHANNPSHDRITASKSASSAVKSS